MSTDRGTLTLGDWLPVWLASYKKGTMKETSFHQLDFSPVSFRRTL